MLDWAALRDTFAYLFAFPNLPKKTPVPWSDNLLRQERAAAVREAVEQLAPRDADFVRLRYGFDGEEQLFYEIGRRYGITGGRVSQRLAQVSGKLRFRLRQWKDQPEREAAKEADSDEGRCEGAPAS